MQTTIDGAGRIVVPKRLRDAMGVRPGQAVEIDLRDGRLEIEVAATPMRLERRVGGPVAIPKKALPVLTATEVRDTLEQIRR